MSQLPTSTNPPTSPIQSICSSYSIDGGPGGGNTGGAAGGIMSDIPDGTIKPVSGTDGDLYVGGRKIGTVDRLAYIQGHKFTLEMAPYLLSMVNAAKAEGVHLKINDGQRTMAEQQTLYNRAPDWGGPGGKTATPGGSPHQCGLAVDFQTKGASWTPAWEWLCKNAYRYGFIRRLKNERWHFEYLGTWPGQEIPDYAVKWAAHRGFPNIWGCGMLHFVPNEPHYRMKSGFWGDDASHPDRQGKSNSWTNWEGEYLIEKFNREDPGWDQRTATPPPIADDELGESEQPTDEPGESESV